MTAKMKAIIAKVNKRDYIKEKDSAHQMHNKKKKKLPVKREQEKQYLKSTYKIRC